MSLIIEDDIFAFNLSPKTVLDPPSKSINSNQKGVKTFMYSNELNSKYFESLVTKSYHSGTQRFTQIAIPFRKKLFGVMDVWYMAQLN